MDSLPYCVSLKPEQTFPNNRFLGMSVQRMRQGPKRDRERIEEKTKLLFEEKLKELDEN